MAKNIYVPEAGRTIAFKDTASDADIQTYLNAKYPQQKLAPAVAAPAAPPESPGLWETAGLGYLSRLQTAAGGAAEGIEGLLGDGGWADYFYDAAQKNLDEANKYQGSRITGADTYGEMATGIGEAAAQSVPDLAAGLAGAYAGGVAGASAGSVVPGVGTLAGGFVGSIIGGGIAAYPSLFGSNIQEQAEEQGVSLKDTNAGTAAAAAAAQAPLEALADRIMLGRLIPKGKVGELIVRGAESTAGKMAKAGATESVTETLQQAIQIGQANPEKLFDLPPEVQQELADAAIVGLGLGAGVRGAVMPFEKMATARQEAPFKQLNEDITKEATDGAEAAKRAEIERGVSSLVSNNVIGDVDMTTLDVAPDPAQPDIKVPVYRVVSKGKEIADFSSMEVAKAAIEQYKARTNASVQLAGDRADSFFQMKPKDVSEAPAFSDPKSRLGARISDRITKDSVPFKGGLSGTIKMGPGVDEAAADTEAPQPTKPAAKPPKAVEPPIPQNTAVDSPFSMGGAFKQNPAGGISLDSTPAPSIFPTPKGVPVDKLNKLSPARPLPPVTPEEISQIGNISKSYKAPNQPGTMRAAVAPDAVGFKRPGEEVAPTDWKGERASMPQPQRTAPLQSSGTVNIGGTPKPSEGKTYKAYLEQYNARKRVLSDALTGRLGKIGTKDFEINLVSYISGDNVPDPVEGRAVYGNRRFNGSKIIIDLAMDVYDPSMTVDELVKKVTGVLNHEVIHGMLDAGLISQTEMNMLRRAARETKLPDKKYTYFNRAYQTYKDILPDNVAAIEEEAVAEMFREWTANPKAAPVPVRGILNRILQFLKRMFSGFKAASQHDVFKDIESGEIGGRDRVYDTSRTSDKFSLSPDADVETRVKALRDSQWGRYFGGTRVNNILNLLDDPENRVTLVSMSPDEYLKLATSGLRNPGQEKVYQENMQRGMKLNTIPMFSIDNDENGEGFVTGHEGRHRAAAFKRMGFKKMPVMLVHSTYRWGAQKGTPPQIALTGQSPLSHRINMPDSIITPMTWKGTEDLNELLREGRNLSNVSIGLAPAESKLDENARLAMKDDPPIGGMSKKNIKESTPGYVPRGIAFMSKPIEAAALEAGATNVYNTSGMGVYGGNAIEPTSTLEAIVPENKAYEVANAVAGETFRVAKDNDQWDAFVAVRIPPEQWTEPHARPGITLFFMPKGFGETARTITEVKDIIKMLPGADSIGGFTAIASQRATNSAGGIENGYEAIRFIWVPEYAGVDINDLPSNFDATLKAMHEIAEFTENKGIASATIDYYDLSLASKDNYDQRIKEHRELRSSGGAGKAGSNGPWRRSVGESVSQRLGKQAEWLAGDSNNIQGTGRRSVVNPTKRFSLSPSLPEMESTPYVESKRDSIFAPSKIDAPIVTQLTRFFFGDGYTPKSRLSSGDTLGHPIFGNLPTALRVQMVDTTARVKQYERKKNKTDNGVDDRFNAQYSAWVSLQMAQRASHVAAASLRKGAPVIKMQNGDINSAYVDIPEGGNDTIVNVIKLLAEGVGPGGEKMSLMNIFRDYSLALRGKRLDDSGIEVPFDPQWIREAIAKGRSQPNVVAAHEMYQRYNKALMKAARDSGVITDAEFATYTGPGDYYGFYREIGYDTEAPRSGSKVAGKIKVLPMKGSQLGSLINDPMIVMVHNINFWTGAIMKNIAAQKTFNLLESMGEARILPPTSQPDPNLGEDPEVMYMRKDGVTKAFAVKDYLLAKALGADESLNAPAWLNLLGMPANLLRETITRDPRFVVANMIRDTMSTWILRGESIVPFTSAFKGMKGALMGSTSYNRLDSFGVVGGYDEASLSPDDMSARLKQRALGESVFDIRHPKDAIRAGWHVLGQLSDASDAASRIPVYDAVLKETGNEYEAAFRALEVMNFSRHGASVTLRYLTKMIPFLNARIQGFDVLYQGLTSAKRVLTGGSRSEDDARMGRRVLVRGLLLAAAAGMLEWYLDDDEVYKELPDYIKTGNILIPVYNTPGKYIAIPKPFEAGFLFATIPQHVVRHWKGSGSLREDAKVFTEQFASTFGLNPLPQAFVPLAENAFNYDMFTGMPLISAGDQRLDPSMRYNANTSKISRMLGEIPISYNTITGRWEGISPVMIDNLISGYGGPMGTYILSATDAIMNLGGVGPDQLPSRSVTEMPGLKQFLVDASSKTPKSVKDAYELFGMVDEVNRTFSRLRASGDAEAAIAYARENMPILQRKRYIMKMVEALNNLKAQERAIERNNTMTVTEKREALNKLTALKVQVTSQVQRLNEELR